MEDVEDCLFLVAFQDLPTLCCNRITTTLVVGSGATTVTINRLSYKCGVWTETDLKRS